MTFPVGWPPRIASANCSLRFYVRAVATANFADRAYLFSQGVGANVHVPLPYVRPGSTDPVAIGDVVVGSPPPGGGQSLYDVAPPQHQNPPATQQAVPTPMLWSGGGIRVTNLGSGDLEFSFDGVNVHGRLLEDVDMLYTGRIEAGIAVRGVLGTTPTFQVEAY